MRDTDRKEKENGVPDEKEEWHKPGKERNGKGVMCEEKG